MEKRWPFRPLSIRRSNSRRFRSTPRLGRFKFGGSHWCARACGCACARSGLRGSRRAAEFWAAHPGEETSGRASLRSRSAISLVLPSRGRPHSRQAQSTAVHFLVTGSGTVPTIVSVTSFPARPEVGAGPIEAGDLVGCCPISLLTDSCDAPRSSQIEARSTG